MRVERIRLSVRRVRLITWRLARIVAIPLVRSLRMRLRVCGVSLLIVRRRLLRLVVLCLSRLVLSVVVCWRLIL